uniref:Carbohydrate sulfotransferase n=1 Tax=Anas platyrhynchos TaxID=8839 RepID=A0A8B9T8I4_ANAPL
MRRSRAPRRLALAACLGSLVLGVFYLQSSLKPAAEDGAMRTAWQGKAGRSPLQALYESDQLEQSSLQAVHQQRRELLSNICSRYTRKRRLLRPDDLRHLVVDDTHGLLYCYVPKVACTNWKRVMMVLTGQASPRSTTACAATSSSSSCGSPSSAWSRRTATSSPAATTRPSTSATGPRSSGGTGRSPATGRWSAGMTCASRSFVYYLLDPRTQREEPFNEHWERVHSLCHPCIVHYDVVGKYETLVEDANYILQLVGADTTVKFPSSSKTTRTTDDMTAQFFQDISPFYQRRLFNLYKMDYLLFNYSIPSYLRIR